MKKLYISTKPYEIGKSREKGELDLLELADKADKEGAWDFSHDRSCWYNLAVGHAVLESGGLEVKKDIKDHSPYGRRVTHYHTHPYCIEKKIIQLLESGTKSKHIHEKFSSEYFKTVSALITCIPSALSIYGRSYNPNDIRSAVIDIKNSPGCELDFAVASGSGVMRYSIQDTDLAEVFYARAHMKIAVERARETWQKKGQCISIAYIVDEMNWFLRDIMKFEFIPKN
jgi:hypothetical protein